MKPQPPLRILTIIALLLSSLPSISHALTPDHLRALTTSIDKHRKGTIIIEAAPNIEITVEQLRHEFWFGAAISNSPFGNRMRPEDREKYLSIFLENFNSAVTENALKWHTMEPRRGNIDYSVVDAMLKWTDQHNIPLRGHNIFWGIPNRVQDWQKAMSNDELRETIKNRALDVGQRYRGRFAEYDLNNEMIHGNYYEDRLGKDITLHMAQWVRQADPNAVLYLNDYDILTGARLDDYIKHIRALLDQGVPIGGIGVQGHLHGDTFDPAALQNALDKLSQFNLPIRVTEFNMPGQRSRFYKDRNLKMTDADEQAKAQNLVDYYRICFAHPRVEGVLMWGFWEGANWIPTSSLYKRDWTPLPAATAYRNLVFNQWWTRQTIKTDSTGRAQLQAFFGHHRLTAGTKTLTLTLPKSQPTKTVSLK